MPGNWWCADTAETETIIRRQLHLCRRHAQQLTCCIATHTDNSHATPPAITKSLKQVVRMTFCYLGYEVPTTMVASGCIPKMPLPCGTWAPSNTWFLWPHESTFQTTYRSLHPFGSSQGSRSVILLQKSSRLSAGTNDGIPCVDDVDEPAAVAADASEVL